MISIIRFILNHTNSHNKICVANLADGRYFGEMALLNNKPRGATIKSDTACFFAVMDKEDYEQSFGIIQTKQIERFVAFLKSSIFL